MLAVAGALPASDDAYAYELKWDGVRALLHVTAQGHRVYSRNDRDITAAYPELDDVARDLSSAGPVVVDGEIVALDAAGKPDFARLQRRMNLAQPAQVALVRHEVPVTFLAFDLLWVRGSPVLDKTYDDRRTLLESLPIGGGFASVPPALQVPADAALAISQAHGLEGLVAKRRNSPYVAGRRSDCWVKVKNFSTVEVIIGGWTEGKGGRGNTLGALLVGVPAARGLRFAGSVGTGFTHAMLASLLETLAPLEVARSPFTDVVSVTGGRRVHWVRPVLVGEVVYSNWTRDGRLRHPSWRGLRSDKSPGDLGPD